MSEQTAPLTVAELIRTANANSQEKGFWDDLDDARFFSNHTPQAALGRVTERALIVEKLDLMHEELSEALAELRDGRELSSIRHEFHKGPDAKPEGFTVELADVIIRVCDLAGKLNLPLERALVEKMAYNRTRPHMHGRKF